MLTMAGIEAKCNNCGLTRFVEKGVSGCLSQAAATEMKRAINLQIAYRIKNEFTPVDKCDHPSEFTPK